MPNATEEDELMIALLKALRSKNEREDALKGVLTRATDAIVGLNTTVAHLAAAVERLERRLATMPEAVLA